MKIKIEFEPVEVSEAVAAKLLAESGDNAVFHVELGDGEREEIVVVQRVEVA